MFDPNITTAAAAAAVVKIHKQSNDNAVIFLSPQLLSLILNAVRFAFQFAFEL